MIMDTSFIKYWLLCRNNSLISPYVQNLISFCCDLRCLYFHRHRRYFCSPAIMVQQIRKILSMSEKRTLQTSFVEYNKKVTTYYLCVLLLKFNKSQGCITHRCIHRTTSPKQHVNVLFIFFSKHKPHIGPKGFISEGAIPALGETRQKLP